jgi:hypothetical protein
MRMTGGSSQAKPSKQESKQATRGGASGSSQTKPSKFLIAHLVENQLLSVAAVAARQQRQSIIIIMIVRGDTEAYVGGAQKAGHIVSTGVKFDKGGDVVQQRVCSRQ